VGDRPKLDLEERTAQVINTVMFGLLGVGATIVILFALVDRIRAATSPANFLHDNWQYALAALFVAVWRGRAIRDGVRALHRRALGQP
jgi:hypothetical protein